MIIVDDDPELQSLLSRLLRDMCDVSLAGDGETALELLSARGAELVLSDLHMPGMRGTELFRRARALDPNIGFIILTGFGDYEDNAELRRTPPDEVIQKPFDINHLRRSVSAVLEHRTEARDVPVPMPPPAH